MWRCRASYQVSYLKDFPGLFNFLALHERQDEVVETVNFSVYLRREIGDFLERSCIFSFDQFASQLVLPRGGSVLDATLFELLQSRFNVIPVNRNQDEPLEDISKPTLHAQSMSSHHRTDILLDLPENVNFDEWAENYIRGFHEIQIGKCVENLFNGLRLAFFSTCVQQLPASCQVTAARLRRFFLYLRIFVQDTHSI